MYYIVYSIIYIYSIIYLLFLATGAFIAYYLLNTFLLPLFYAKVEALYIPYIYLIYNILYNILYNIVIIYVLYV